MNNIIVTPAVKQKYIDLKSSQTPFSTNQVSKEVDGYVVQKYKDRTTLMSIGLWATASLIPALKIEFSINKLKKTLTNNEELAKRIKNLRKAHLYAPVLFGMGLAFAYSEIVDKIKANIIPKWKIYQTMGLPAIKPNTESFYLRRYREKQKP